MSYSVSDLNLIIKTILESTDELGDIEVTGEISNLTKHGSGHYYFTLKDAQSQISCVMFKNYTAMLETDLREGMNVTVLADTTVYTPRGTFQLTVKEVSFNKTGDLYEAFNALKKKLEKEGLFDVANKKTLPFLPRTIGLITSPTGAVIQDIMRTINRRFPAVEIVFKPALVQGLGAVNSVIAALQIIDNMPQVEVIIIARGGGSMEDLWTFNEEELARAIFACSKPVISAIGHETDFTIADFVSDYRASTPTAAAEMVLPEQQDIVYTLNDMKFQMNRNIERQVNFMRQRLDDHQDQLNSQMLASLNSFKATLKLHANTLEMSNYDHILNKGFTLSFVKDKKIKSSLDLKIDDELTTYYAQGKSISTITKTQ